MSTPNPRPAAAPLAPRTRAALDQGTLALEANLLPAAAGYLDLARRAAPQHPETRLLTARLRLRAKHVDLAVAALADGRRLTPDDRGVLTTAIGLAARDRAAAALVELTALSAAAVTPAVRRARVALLLRAGRVADAAAVLDRLRRTDHHPAVARTWAFITRPAGAPVPDVGPAARPTTPSVSLPPSPEPSAMTPSRDDFTAHAIALLHTGRRREAGRAFFRAARIATRSGAPAAAATAWAGLALSAQLEARDNLRQRADAKLASLTDRAGRRALVGKLYAHTVTAPDPRRAPAPGTGSPLQSLLDDAADTLARAAVRHPARADVHYHRAACDAARGETAAAARSLRCAVQINPDFAAARSMAERLGLVFAEPDEAVLDPYGV